MNVLKLSLVASLAVLASACGAVSNSGGTASPTPTNTPSGDLTISDIQKGNVEESTSVTLEGVVVTAIKVGGSGVDFWAQDVGGGAQSGLYFFDKDGVTPADIAVGDELTVSGVYTEFYDLSEVTIEAVEITNSGLTPDVDAVAIADLADPTAVEVWESCLVEVSDAGLTVSGSVNQYSEFPVSDGTDTLLVDDLLYDATADVAAGSVVNYLAGVVNYAFEEWKLLPRDVSDVDVEGGVVVPLTIADIQSGTIAPDGAVTVENVIVTAIRGTTGFWAQDVGGGPNSGLYFFAQVAGTFPTGIALGDEVTVTGTYKEYFNLSEVVISDVEITTNANAIVVDDVPLADIDLEQWESCLVNVTSASPISVTVAANQYGQITVGDGASTALVDNFIFDVTTYQTGTVLTTLRGVLNYSFDEWQLEPRDANDIVAQ